jgi:hypothetical protein
MVAIGLQYQLLQKTALENRVWTGGVHTGTMNIDVFPGIDMRVPRLRAPHGARRGSSVFLEISIIDPPQGSLRGGGTYHNRGYGVSTPIILSERIQFS